LLQKYETGTVSTRKAEELKHPSKAVSNPHVLTLSYDASEGGNGCFFTITERGGKSVKKDGPKQTILFIFFNFIFPAAAGNFWDASAGGIF
jgi:hypothetical protein